MDNSTDPIVWIDLREHELLREIKDTHEQLGVLRRRILRLAEHLEDEGYDSIARALYAIVMS